MNVTRLDVRDAGQGEPKFLWPKSLIVELADRRCIVVSGSGVSAGAPAENHGGGGLPTWKALLQAGSSEIDEASSILADTLIEGSRFIDAAQVIQRAMSAADFGNWIADNFGNISSTHSSGVQRAILDIDPRIIVSLNYDRLLDRDVEDYSDGYAVCKYYDSHVVDALRSPKNLVLKAHGCVSNPQMIILSRSQYFRARRDFGRFYDVLDALFITHTLLFVGCGFNGDPDIDLVLQNANLAAPSSHRHVAVVPDTGSDPVLEALGEAYNLDFYKYDNADGSHSVLLEAMEDLRDQVSTLRVSRG